MDKEYPSNVGVKWVEEEVNTLLEELHNNIDIEIIAQNHKRTIGGINARRREIAYNLYIQNYSISEIIKKTKLDEKIIEETIDKRKNNKPKDKPKDKPKNNPKDKPKDNPKDNLENEIIELKNEIKELKNIVIELVDYLKKYKI
jgi:predicted RNase H-like nuclease (RuvC/YqgF family)